MAKHTNSKTRPTPPWPITTRWPPPRPITPLAPYAEYRAARLLFDTDKPAEAAARFAKLREQYPDHKLAREGVMGQASSLATSGKHQQALDALAAMDQSDPQVALARGTSLAGLKKWDEAIAALTTATNAEGEFADRDRAWYELGWANREADKQEPARQAFSKLATEFADSSLARDAMFRVGESYYETGDFVKSAEWFAKSAEWKRVGCQSAREGVAYARLVGIQTG